MKNSMAPLQGRNLSNGLIFKSRYVIVNLELGRELVIEDFYAFTYKEAVFHFSQSQSLLSGSDLVLLAYSSLEGWKGDGFGDPAVRSGKAYVAHKVVPAGVEIINGKSMFIGSHSPYKYDLTLVRDQAGQNAVAFDGVLWARDHSAESVLGRVGREIDELFEHDSD